MTTVLIILGYIASVFLSRWLNYIVYKRDRDMPILWGIWLIPIVSQAVLLVHVVDIIEFKKNWFTGKNWGK